MNNIISNLSSTLQYIDKLKLAHQSRLNKLTKLDHSPFEFILEPTNNCNLKCIKCVHGTKMKRKKYFISLDDYRIVLSKIQDYAETIFFTGGGEPTLHKDLYTMIKEAKQKDIKRTWLLTNGTLLKPTDYPTIIDSHLDNLEFTLDGTDKENHEKVSIGSNFEKTISNIKSFLEFKKEVKSKRPFTIIKIIQHSVNQPKKIGKEFISQFKDLPVDRIYIKPLTYHSEYSRIFLEDEQFIGQNRNAILNYDWQNYYVCLSIYMQVMIAASGDVIACCGDLEGINNMGNLLEEKANVLSIWNNQKFINLRKRIINQELKDPCSICSALWQGKPPSIDMQYYLSQMFRIPMQMARDFYPQLAKIGYKLKLDKLNKD